MQTYTIFGKVADANTKEGVAQLRVEAWDKDLILDDLLGSAITLQDGSFRIVFDDKYFKELFLERRPDLYFKVFRGTQLLKNTEDSIIWNLDREGIEMVIEIEPISGDTTIPGNATDQQVATRSLLQATYTPRKPPQGESPSAAPRGLEKAAFMACLSPLKGELDELVQQYETPGRHQVSIITPVATVDTLKVVQTISSALSPLKQIKVLHSARQFATLAAMPILQVAKDLVELRQSTLNRVLITHERILTEYVNSFAGSGIKTNASISSISVQILMQWALKNNVEKQDAEATLALGCVLGLKLDKLKIAQFGSWAARQIDRQRERVDGFKESLQVEPIGYLHLEKMSFTPAGIERGELVYSVPLSPGEEVNVKHREWSHTSEEFERIVTDYMEEFSEEGVSEKNELSQSVNSQNQHSTAFNTNVSTSGEAFGWTISASVGYSASDSASKSEQLTRSNTREITSKASSRAKSEHKISFRVASARETEDETVQRIKNPYADKATRVDYYQLIRKWKVDLYRCGIRLTWDLVIPEPASGLLDKILEINNLRKALEEGFTFPLKPEEVSLDPTSDQYYGKLAAEYNAGIMEVPPALTKSVEISPLGPTDWSKNWNNPPPAYSEKIEFSVPDDYVISDIKFTYDCALSGIPSSQKDENGNPKKDEYGCFLYDYTGNTTNNTITVHLYHRGSDLGLYWEHYQDELVPNPHKHDSHPEHYVGHSDDHKYVLSYWKTRPELIEKSGSFVIIVRYWHVLSFFMKVDVVVELNEESRKVWQVKLWSALRAGAEEQYYQKRQMLQDKLSNLEQALGSQDALSLRKKEREEVMKGVLRWLNIPSFEFFPEEISVDPQGEDDMEDALYSESGLVKNGSILSAIREQGEKIKFLHHSIEWENMLYFLYPYFWTHPSQWEFKKSLDHPDRTHLAFLKAGAARVVLTIRPGFEEAFIAFVQTGDMNSFPPSPYLEIGEEFKNYAQTNYPGIPPANPIQNFRILLTPNQKKTWDAMENIMGLLKEYSEFPYPTQKQAWEDIRKIQQLLQIYFNNNNVYPQALDELEPNPPYILTVPQNDPWGNPYRYEITDGGSVYSLASYGANGQSGGTGEDADITNLEMPPRGLYPQANNWVDARTALVQRFPDKEIPERDVWGNYYSYKCPGNHGDYDLASWGADGQVGGDGENSDITSWAEASLIGTWYEYTPTSALDIDFDRPLSN